LLVDARGIPLSLVASGANTHDVKLLEATLDVRVRNLMRQHTRSSICARMRPM